MSTTGINKYYIIWYYGVAVRHFAYESGEAHFYCQFRKVRSSHIVLMYGTRHWRRYMERVNRELHTPT